MTLDQTRHLFILESRELLQDMEAGLLALLDAEPGDGHVDAIFRAAHTIKGSAGLFGLDVIVAFAHVLEHVLDEVRADRLPIGPTLVELLLACGDHIGALVDAAEADSLDTDRALQARGQPLLDRLHATLGAPAAASAPDAAMAPERSAPAAPPRDWSIALRFGRDTLRHGMDPLSFIRYLERVGTLLHIDTLIDAVPGTEEMEPESCYLGFAIALRSAADQATIEGVFEFVRDDCEIEVLPQDAGIATGVPAGTHAPAAMPRPTETQARPPENRSVRVDADKLDTLINLVGELIIAAAGTQLEARRARLPALLERSSTLGSLVEAVRDSALQLRMVKIGGVFRRFQRVVHDVSRELGKDIALELHGEDTELDKTLVEQIADPLTHLVRNAIDHGIGPAELRLARGKPARGTVRLNAFHESGSVVIEVSDDGAGLRRDRILAKAIEQGLVDANAKLDDKEIHRLIFEPGFSTAQRVTNLSGRGVGMDVVKRNIAALRGSVDVRSEEGVGTTFSIRLPLTLAIIDGFLVNVAGSVFVVPLDRVDECIDYSAEPGHDYTNLRGEVLPFVSLRDLFEFPQAPSARQNIVIVRHGECRFGLVVDALVGEFQTVIKPLGKMFEHIKCISGSTILGNGEVALILDVPALAEQAGSLNPIPSTALAA